MKTKTIKFLFSVFLFSLMVFGFIPNIDSVLFAGCCINDSNSSDCQETNLAGTCDDSDYALYSGDCTSKPQCIKCCIDNNFGFSGNCLAPVSGQCESGYYPKIKSCSSYTCLYGTNNTRCCVKDDDCKYPSGGNCDSGYAARETECTAIANCKIAGKCCVLKNNSADPGYGTSANCSNTVGLCQNNGGSVVDGVCDDLPACGGDTTTGGTTTTGGSTTNSFDNPLQYDTLEQFLQVLLSHIKSVIAIIAVLMVVLGGVFYVASAGNPDMVNRAKACWTAAAIGFAIVIAAPSFLKEIGDILGLTSTGDASVDNALTMSDIALNILNFLLSVIGILAIIMMVIGGMMYMMDFGSEKRSETGKKMIGYAVVGLVVALSSLILVKQIGNIIGN